MVCDGEISEGELAALKRWLAGHPDAAVLYPGKTVAERLLRIYEDGIITPDERQELNELLLDQRRAVSGVTITRDCLHPGPDPWPTRPKRNDPRGSAPVSAAALRSNDLEVDALDAA